MTVNDPRAVVAVDLGTSALKAAVVALDGHVLGRGRVPLSLLHDGEPGRAEQDALGWWAALADAVRSALRAAALAGPVEPIAMCCVGHGPTLVPTAADGSPVGPAMTWLDQRPGGDVAEVAARIGRSGWTVTLLGCARHVWRLDPARDAATAWYLSAWDHLAFRLAGRAATALADPADAITVEEAAAVGLDERAAPPPIRSGEPLGGLLPGPAAALGLRPGLPVVAGVNDAIAAFLGAGLTEPGQAVDTGGTSGGFGLYVDGSPAIPGLWTGAAPLPGLRYVGGAMAGTGRALDWLAGGALGQAVPVAVLLGEAEAVVPAAGGLVFLPYLAGER
ncbi:MAG: FGGY family carbohydrate kinase, partial [Chloroflexi bacterium]|nr:FGGY family carbohydrate kinase [Chloroflexota bacterium]